MRSCRSLSSFLKSRGGSGEQDLRCGKRERRKIMQVIFDNGLWVTAWLLIICFTVVVLAANKYNGGGK